MCKTEFFRCMWIQMCTESLFSLKTSCNKLIMVPMPVPQKNIHLCHLHIYMWLLSDLHCDGSGGVSGVGETDDSSVTHELGTGHEIQLAGTRMGLSRHGTNRLTSRETPASFKDCLMFHIVTVKFCEADMTYARLCRVKNIPRSRGFCNYYKTKIM